MRYINFNKKTKKYKKTLFVLGCLILVSLAVAIFSGPGSTFSYIFGGGLGIKNENGRVNILLLGNAGEMHDGPYLTDTIMVASIDLKDQKIDLISLPRDLWLDEYKLKLNAVYATKESSGGGLKFTKVAVSEILGVPIHYGVRLDFKGFVKAVDQLGGLNIDVERSFVDSLYPIAGKENELCGFKEEEKEFSAEEAAKLNIQPGKMKVLIAPDGKIATDSADPDKGLEYFACRYEKISFSAGPTRMDGITALKFVRSRMGSNNEGSDFARSKRQQKVLEAFRKKILSFDTLINPAQIKELITTFGRSVEVDIPVDDAIILYGFIKKTDTAQSFVIDGQKENSLLINPPVGEYGAWVLVPKSGNYNDIHQYVQKILQGEVKNEGSSSARPSN